jgi:hypothetical protein
VSEVDAIPFSACQERHDITIDQFDLREVESDDTVFLQRCAKDSQVFSGHATADAKNDTLFHRESIDSARHGRVACCPMRLNRKRNATRNALEVQQNSMSGRSGSGESGESGGSRGSGGSGERQ